MHLAGNMQLVQFTILPKLLTDSAAYVKLHHVNTNAELIMRRRGVLMIHNACLVLLLRGRFNAGGLKIQAAGHCSSYHWLSEQLRAVPAADFDASQLGRATVQQPPSRLVHCLVWAMATIAEDFGREFCRNCLHLEAPLRFFGELPSKRSHSAGSEFLVGNIPVLVALVGALKATSGSLCPSGFPSCHSSFK